jgi:hypothetical protein
MWCLVVSQIVTTVSEELPAPILWGRRKLFLFSTLKMEATSPETL